MLSAPFYKAHISAETLYEVDQLGGAALVAGLLTRLRREDGSQGSLMLLSSSMLVHKQ